MYQNASGRSDSMTDLGEGLFHSIHRLGGAITITSLIRRWNMKRTLSEGLPQLFGDPLYRLGRDLGPKVAVERRRCSSLLREPKYIFSIYVDQCLLLFLKPVLFHLLNSISINEIIDSRPDSNLYIKLLL